MKKCYTKIIVKNGRTNLELSNHDFSRYKYERLNTCTICGVIVNNELLELANIQTHGKFTQLLEQQKDKENV